MLKVINRHIAAYGSCFLLAALAIVITFAPAAAGNVYASSTALLDLCNEFNALNTRIRDNTIKKPAAKEQFRTLIEAIRKEYYLSGGPDYATSSWVFPLKGYGYKAIGGVKSNGYQKGGYDYFDGNRHSGHPSQDIFIRDKKQAAVDDVTKKPVSVVSLTGGIVVAEEKNWNSSSALRGGKYIWIFDPTSNALIYYAHNSTLHVEVGDIITPGDVIAEVGRTGLNAHKRRSPSHLHITYLSLVNNLPVPKNIFKELLNSTLI